MVVQIGFQPAGGRDPNAADFPGDQVTPPPDLPRAANFRVGVIDTGLVVDSSGAPHSWLAGHVEFGPGRDDTIPDDGKLEDGDHHGTFVTGLILREAPTATVRMIGAIDEARLPDVVEANVAAAIGALAEDCRLINMSFTGHEWERGLPQSIIDALALLPRDLVVVMAAGNHGSSVKSYPACVARQVCPARLVAVGAAGGDPARPFVADFSNYNAVVEAFAPGERVAGPFGTNGWTRWSGTSFAAATVTGRIAQAMIDGARPREAVGQILTGSRVTVHDVNGGYTRPYVASEALPL